MMYVGYDNGDGDGYDDGDGDGGGYEDGDGDEVDDDLQLKARVKLCVCLLPYHILTPRIRYSYCSYCSVTEKTG